MSKKKKIVHRFVAKVAGMKHLATLIRSEKKLREYASVPIELQIPWEAIKDKNHLQELQVAIKGKVASMVDELNDIVESQQ